MKIKQFIKTAFVFLTGNMLSKLVSFFLLPLYTSKIDPAQFGNYDVASSFISLIAPIAFFQIWDGMYRYAFEYKDKDDKQMVISNSVVVCLFGLVLYLAMFSLLQMALGFQYFWLVLIYGVLYSFHYLHTYAARVYLSNKLFVFSGVASTLITAISNIILILGFGWDIKSIYVSSIIGLLAQIFLIEIKIGVFRKFRCKDLDKGLIKKMMRFSIPLCVAAVSYWLLSGLTKIFIQTFEGDAANGLYAVANKFGSLITLLVSVIQFAWNETAYLMTEDDPTKKKESYGECISIMTIGVLFGTALVCIAVKVIFPLFVAKQYADALALIPATIIGVATNALAGFMGTIFMAEKKNSFVMISTFIAAGVNVVAGYFATKYWGLHGGVVTLAACFTLLFLMRLFRLLFAFKLKMNGLAALLGGITLTATVFAFYYISSLWWTMLVGVAVAGLLVLGMKKYVALLFLAYKEKGKKKQGAEKENRVEEGQTGEFEILCPVCQARLRTDVKKGCVRCPRCNAILCTSLQKRQIKGKETGK